MIGARAARVCLGGRLLVVATLTLAPAACRRSSAPAPATSRLAFAEAVVELRADIGQRQTREVRLTGAAATGARLTVESVEDPALEVRILGGGGVAPEGLALAFTGDHAGTRTGQVVVATADPEVPRLTLLYALRVPSHVEVVPSNPYFNLRDPAARARLLRVRGARADFRLLAATVVEGPFRAVIRPAPAPAEAVVEVVVAPSAVAADQRGLLGKLRLRTNDPAEPELDVPLFAMGALPGAAPDARAP